MSCVLSKVLDERPENAADIIEDISKDVKRSKFVSKVDTVQDKVDKSTEVALAEIHNKLFSVSLCINVMYDQLLMVYWIKIVMRWRVHWVFNENNINLNILLLSWIGNQNKNISVHSTYSYSLDLSCITQLLC